MCIRDRIIKSSKLSNAPAADREFTISRGMPVLEMKSAKEMNGPFPEVAERSLRIDDAVAVLIFLTCVRPIRNAPDSTWDFSPLRFTSGPST